jgi:hypothetical protein
MNYVALAKEALSKNQPAHPFTPATTETTKTTKVPETVLKDQTVPLEHVLKGRAIELWSDALGERFWLVADEADAARLGEPRGTVYTAAEARQVVRIGDPAAVAEIHRWKRKFEGVIRER